MFAIVVERHWQEQDKANRVTQLVGWYLFGRIPLFIRVYLPSPYF